MKIKNFIVIKLKNFFSKQFNKKNNVNNLIKKIM
jgi:hypothetical protein